MHYSEVMSHPKMFVEGRVREFLVVGEFLALLKHDVPHYRKPPY